MEEMEKQMKKLELYVHDQKYALNQAEFGITSSQGSSLNNHRFTMKFHDHKAITYDAMVEPFLQTVVESRVAMRQLCKTIVTLLQEQCDGKGMEGFGRLIPAFQSSVQVCIKQ